MKTISLRDSVYNATEKYPELIEIIANMGFPQIRNSFMRKAMGRDVSLGEAIKRLGLSTENVKKQLADKGFLLS